MCVYEREGGGGGGEADRQGEVRINTLIIVIINTLINSGSKVTVHTVAVRKSHTEYVFINLWVLLVQLDAETLKMCENKRATG